MDAYTPGGVIGKRPDYADVVYGNYIRRNFPDSPIILGGIEASLRRLAHYDYWSDKLKRSILIEAQADIISYGMGEHSIVEIADALNSGLPVSELTFIRGTVCKVRSLDRVPDALVLPTYDELTKIRNNMQPAFISSTAILIHLRQNSLLSHTDHIFMSFKIHLPIRLQHRRWMTCMSFLI